MLKKYLSLVRFEHTIFALPFALASAVVAARGIPPLPALGWLLLCMVGARTAAMGFNRIADRKIDAKNPRTRSRELVTGAVKPAEAWALVALSTVLFVWGAAMLNPLALILSPVALLVIFGYSYAKRFTAAAHLILGLALALAPIGAWIALTGELSHIPVLLGAGVALWTAGFDILYALQDIDFDRREKLFSIPALVGVRHSLMLSRLLHLLALVFFILFGIYAGLGVSYAIGILVVGASLVVEHSVLHPRDLSRLNLAFFAVNGYISVAFFAFVLIDILSR